MPPAGFVTVTFTVPAVAMSAAGIAATIWVLVTDEGVLLGTRSSRSWSRCAVLDNRVKIAEPRAVLIEVEGGFIIFR